MLRETSLHLEHPNPSFERKSKTLVRIYNYPIDGELKDLETVLKQYGKFINITPVHDHYGLATGEKTTVMEISKDIPSFLYVGKHQVEIRYQHQPQICRKSYKTGHLAKDCTEGATCRECGAKDHERRNCPKKICFYCGKMGHISIECDENRQPQQMDITTDGKETEQPSTLEPEDTTTTRKAESEKKQATAGDSIPETSTNMSLPNGEGDSNKTKTTPTTQNETTTTISDISEEETDNTIKNSDSEYDPNEIFFARQPTRPKRDLKYSPKRTQKESETGNKHCTRAKQNV